MSKRLSGNGHASSTSSGNQSIVSMFKKQLKNVERTAVPQTTSLFIDISDEEHSAGITVEDRPSSAKRGVSSSGSAKCDVLSAGELVSGKATRSSRLSLKRGRNVETANDAKGSSSVGISAGCKEQRHSYAKETRRTALPKDQNACTIKSSENPAISVSGTKPGKRFHKTDTSEIKPRGFVNHSLEDNNDTTPPDLDSNLIAEENQEDAQVPYYLENFLHVLKTVTEDEFYSELFNDDDRSVIRTFEELPGKLYSLAWFPELSCVLVQIQKSNINN